MVEITAYTTLSDIPSCLLEKKVAHGPGDPNRKP